MTELEIEANLSIKAEWDLIQEAGKKLAPCYGPGYTGMINLGNRLGSKMSVCKLINFGVSNVYGHVFQPILTFPHKWKPKGGHFWVFLAAEALDRIDKREFKISNLCRKSLVIKFHA